MYARLVAHEFVPLLVEPLCDPTKQAKAITPRPRVMRPEHVQGETLVRTLAPLRVSPRRWRQEAGLVGLVHLARYEADGQGALGKWPRTWCDLALAIVSWTTIAHATESRWPTLEDDAICVHCINASREARRRGDARAAAVLRSEA